MKYIIVINIIFPHKRTEGDWFHMNKPTDIQINKRILFFKLETFYIFNINKLTTIIV